MAKAKLLDAKGDKKSEVKLSPEVFEVQPNRKMVSQAVRVHLINKRQGTRSTKGRSDMHFTGKKVYRQKKTGRARHGDKTANIFVHGAVAHGPKPFVPRAAMPRAMKETALKSALSLLAKKGEIYVIEKFCFDGKGSTKKAAKLLHDKLKFEKCLIVSSSDENAGLGVRNLSGIRVTRSKLLHTYAVVISPRIMFTKQGLRELETRLKSTKANKK